MHAYVGGWDLRMSGGSEVWRRRSQWSVRGGGRGEGKVVAGILLPSWDKTGDIGFAEEEKAKMYSYPTCFPGQGPQVSLYSNPSSLFLNNTEEHH